MASGTWTGPAIVEANFTFFFVVPCIEGPTVATFVPCIYTHIVAEGLVRRGPTASHTLFIIATRRATGIGTARPFWRDRDL
jgi:hypothetical protein